jgi:hypothetical protein
VRKVTLVLAVVGLSLAALPVMAQGPGGFGGPGGGGMPPQMQKLMEQMKYRRQMRDQLRAINEINRDPSTAVTPVEAKKLLVILKPWTTKDKMTEEQAKGIMRSVKGVMTPRQLTAMGNVRPQRGFGGRPGGGPGGRPGAPGGPGGFAGRPGGGPGGPGRGPGGGRGFNLARMKDANFLSTKSDPSSPFGSRRAEGNKRMLAMLEARAHGAKATAKR